MKFQLFRYILTPVQISLFNEGKALSKQEAIKEVLVNKLSFFTSKEYLYLPIKTEILETFIFAQIGKKGFAEHYLKDQDQFITRKEEEWPYRNVIINIAEHIQLIAFEYLRNDIFSEPSFVLNKLAVVINEIIIKYGWNISFEPVFETDQFWQFVERNQGGIKKLKFSLYVPNLFGTNEALKKELESAKQNYSAQKVDTELNNDQGNLLIPKTPFVEEGIELVAKGAGKVIVETRSGRRFSSEDRTKFVKITHASIPIENEEELKQVLDSIFEEE